MQTETRTVELDTDWNEAPAVYLGQVIDTNGGERYPAQAFRNSTAAFIATRQSATERLGRRDYVTTIHEDGEKTKLRQICLKDLSDLGESTFLLVDSDGNEVGRFTITQTKVE